MTPVWAERVWSKVWSRKSKLREYSRRHTKVLWKCRHQLPVRLKRERTLSAQEWWRKLKKVGVEQLSGNRSSSLHPSINRSSSRGHRFAAEAEARNSKQQSSIQELPGLPAVTRGALRPRYSAKKPLYRPLHPKHPTVGVGWEINKKFWTNSYLWSQWQRRKSVNRNVTMTLSFKILDDGQEICPTVLTWADLTHALSKLKMSERWHRCKVFLVWGGGINKRVNEMQTNLCLVLGESVSISNLQRITKIISLLIFTTQCHKMHKISKKLYHYVTRFRQKCMFYVKTLKWNDGR